MKLIINKLVYKNPCIDPLSRLVGGKEGIWSVFVHFLGGGELPSIYSDILLIFKYSERYSGKWRYIYIFWHLPEAWGEGEVPWINILIIEKERWSTFKVPNEIYAEVQQIQNVRSISRKRAWSKCLPFPICPEPLSEFSLTQQVQRTIIGQCTIQVSSIKRLIFMTQMEPRRTVLWNHLWHCFVFQAGFAFYSGKIKDLKRI